MARNRIEFAVRVKDDASHNLQKISKEVDGVSSSLKRLGAGIITIGTAIEIARIADSYRLLQNRLRLVTVGTGELKAVTDELVKVSIRSRTSFQSTADLYARVARSSRTLGLSQQELLDFTETVTKSIRISGSTSQEAAAGVIQFGQALASSRLSGDELRSVLEQMPRLAQAIAEGFENVDGTIGTTIGTLRELGEKGELSATKVLDALRRTGPAIEKEFASLFPLVSEAFENLQTGIFDLIGRLDEAAGISKIVADAILGIADQVVLLGKALTGALKPGDEMSVTFQRIAIFALTAAGAIEALITAASAVGSRQFKTVGEFFAALTAQIATGGSMSQIDAISDAFNERLDEIWSEEDLDKKRDEIILNVTDMMEKIGKIMSDFPRAVIDPFDLSGASGAP